MSIKTEVLFFKYLLCIREIVRTGKISEAAVQNGMKESNLSKTIKDIETLTNRKLFVRTSSGIVPTREAIEIAYRVEQMMQNTDDLRKAYFKNGSEKNVFKVYVEPGLEICDLENISQKIIYTDVFEDADVTIGLHKPKSVQNRVCIENKIGSFVKQTVWVSAQNRPEVLDLTTLIISKFYDQ